MRSALHEGTPAFHVINMLHKQEDTQTKEADPFVAETKPRGKWPGYFSERLAAGWHPSVPVRTSQPYPIPASPLWTLGAVSVSVLESLEACSWEPSHSGPRSLKSRPHPLARAPQCGGCLAGAHGLRRNSGGLSSLRQNAGQEPLRGEVCFGSQFQEMLCGGKTWRQKQLAPRQPRFNVALARDQQYGKQGVATTTKGIPLWPYVHRLG
ncbi:hypothetical protein LEMLEM_LOCUS21807 [Lemmus lemmus]